MEKPSLANNKWVRRAAWVAGGVAALWAVGWLAVPPLLKHQAQKIASEKTGRTVRIGEIDFKPWTLELTVSDLAIATADGRADQLRIKRIYIDSEMQSLLRLAPVVDALVVDEPVARLTHLGHGRYDIDDLVQKLTPPADQPPSAPLQFALYNLALHGGAFDFVDTTVGKTHTLRDLRLDVPFLSNLEAQRNIHTAPRLAFKLNGSAFDSAAETTPFAQSHKTHATLKLSALDLAPYLGYLPASVPVRLVRAVLDADLQIAFEQNPAPVVRLSGVVQAHDVRLDDAKQQALLAFEHLKLGLEDVRPLAQSGKLSAVELTAPALTVHRARDGRMNLDLASPNPDPAKPKTKAAEASVSRSEKDGAKTIANNDHSTLGSASKNSKPDAASTWKIDVAQVAVRGGRVDWTDDTTSVGQGDSARLALRDLVLNATGIVVPLGGAGVQPIPFHGSAALQGAPAAKPGAGTPRPASKTAVSPAPPPSATLQFSGSASAQAASVTATVSALPLEVAAPYVAQFLEPALGGTLQAAVGVTWQAAGTQGGAGGLVVKLDRLALDKLALTQGKTTLAAVQGLELKDALIDPAAQSATLGKLTVTNPKVKIERHADGRWMAQAWLKDAGAGAATTPPAKVQAPKGRKPDVAQPATPAKKDGPPWKLAINDLLLSGGTVGWSDLATPRPVAFDVSALRVEMQHFTLEGKKPATLQVAARLASGRTEPGKLSYRGTLGLSPVMTQGAVEVVHLPVHAFEPYFGDALNIELLRADASFKGTVHYVETPAGPRVRATGDTAIEEFRANSVPGTAAGAGTVASTAATASSTVVVAEPATAAARPAGRRGLGLGEELLSWKALSLRGLDVSLAPGTATTVDVKETALSDFFARVVVRESGRINLQDLVKSTPASAPASSTGTTALASGSASLSKTVANNDQSTLGSGQKDLKNGSAPVAQADPNAPVIRFGPVSLLGGRVYFSDRFIKPNYSANLTELTGQLSAFSSVSPDGSPQLADLELRGRAEGTASLEILGKLNPLAKPLALDIKGKVRDLELAPLSPYSVKYAGHGIERGKLSVDVGYLVLPNGQLTASNQIILNQLTFGDKVEGAPASLPVKLAVALLADRNGVIDINLPISGSLNDPQFRLGPVIFKVIVNLIVKAITSPFSLLASAFGGGDELSQVAFAPGSAVLTAQATQGLDKVAKALTDRPALKMTVVGIASLEAERAAYKRERLQALVQAEKRRLQVLSGSTNGTATITVSPAEYPELLKAVYKRADMPKPRNLVGMTKDIPQAEMEALLLAHVPATEELMRALATQRGVAVRDYLASRQLPLERLFLGAPKVGEDKAPAGTTATPWTPRAELGLSPR